MKTAYTYGLNKGFGLKFKEGNNDNFTLYNLIYFHCKIMYLNHQMQVHICYYKIHVRMKAKDE